MALKCDVQYRKGDSGFRLTRVGVTGVHKPIRIGRPDAAGGVSTILNCCLDVFVDLPAEQRGSHLSRNVEVLQAVAEESLACPITGLENMAAEIVKRLLERHEYAQNAEVHITSDYFRPSETPSGRKTMEMYTLHAGAVAVRGQPVRKTIGAEVIGMTACPCAQESIAEMLGAKDSPFPGMSHNQRNVCTILMDMDENTNIEADDLIDVAQKSFSTPTYELLKREDEGQVVINAHSNTRFVEDVVRSALTIVVRNFTELPDDVGVKVISDSEESIHKHNAYAERTATLGELRAEHRAVE